MRLRPIVGQRQRLLGSRTTRMLELDLFDCEQEIALHTTDLFELTGISYPRADLEIEMTADSGGYPPREIYIPSVGEVFEDPASRVDRLWVDRRKLLLRLANQSMSWRMGLNDVAGNVSTLTSTVDGEVTRLGTPGDCIAELWENPDAFPDPAFYDAMFTRDVDPEDVRSTRDYRHFCPWFLNDVKEELVARWVYEHLGMHPWSGSMEHYQMLAKPREEWDEYLYRFEDYIEQIMSAAEFVADRRQMQLSMQVRKDPKQRLLQLRDAS